MTDPDADPYEAYEVQWDYVEPPPVKLAAQLAAQAAAALQAAAAEGELGDAEAAASAAPPPPLVMQGVVTQQILDERDKIKRVSAWQIGPDPDDERRARRRANHPAITGGGA